MRKNIKEIGNKTEEGRLKIKEIKKNEFLLSTVIDAQVIIGIFGLIGAYSTISGLFDPNVENKAYVLLGIFVCALIIIFLKDCKKDKDECVKDIKKLEQEILNDYERSWQR